MEDEGKFLRYEPCPDCGSKDNIAVWEKTNANGAKYEQRYCFTCAQRKGSSGATEGRLQDSRAPRTLQHPYPPRTGGISQLTFRKLSKDTCAKYNVVRHGPIVYFPSVWEGKVVGYKVRDFLFPKQNKLLHMYIEGDYSHFFGWQAVHTTRILAIAYGEFDAMSVFEATQIPCLSPPSGDGSLKSAIKKDWERLAQFEKIVFLPDQDESGAKFTDEAVQLLGEDRCFVASLSYKDPNDYLLDGKPSILKQHFYAASSAASNLFVTNPSELISESTSVGVFSGIQQLDRSLQGFRAQEATYILGAPSHGKTTFVQNLLYHLIDQNIRVGALVLEGTHKKFVTRLANIIYGGNVLNAPPEQRALVNHKIDSFFTLAQLTGRTTSVDSLRKTVTAAVKAMDTKFLVIDNLTGASDPSKFFESSSGLVMAIDDLVTSLDVHIFVVSHVGRGNYAEPPTLSSGLGSGHIERFGYNIIGVHLRDNLTRLEVLKNREHGHSANDVFFAELDRNSLHFRFFNKNEKQEKYNDAITVESRAVGYESSRAGDTGLLSLLGKNLNFSKTN